MAMPRINAGKDALVHDDQFQFRVVLAEVGPRGPVMEYRTIAHGRFASEFWV
jgi:hypothetical protein